MASNKHLEDLRANAEIVHGAEECYKHSLKMLEELGFPRGVLPLKNLEECGLVRETGYVWMKQKAPYEYFFTGTNSVVRYGTEVTAFVEKGKMKKMSGVKSKQLLLWVPIVEMSIEQSTGNTIYFKTPMGIGRSFPITSFMDEEEKHLEKPVITLSLPKFTTRTPEVIKPHGSNIQSRTSNRLSQVSEIVGRWANQTDNSFILTCSQAGNQLILLTEMKAQVK